MQYKEHPFTLLVCNIFPLILPSATIRSARDGEKYPSTFPLIDYIIIRGGREVLNKGKNTFEAIIDVQIDILVKETSPLSWCEYDDLADAKSRQALFEKFHSYIREFIKIAANPTRLSKLIKLHDVLWSEYDFRFVQTIGTEYHNRKGASNFTGISSVMQFSYIPQDDDVCCLDDGTNDFYEALRGIVEPGSTSDKLIQNEIV